MTSARKNGEHFILQAQTRGVKAIHIMDIGNSEEIIARITSTDAGIRYVLSKPNNATVTKEKDHAHVPVFDLRCSRL